MPMKFISRDMSSYDEASKVSIIQPRMFVENKPDGSTRVEYEYTLLKSGERIGGIGLSGTQTIVKKNENTEWIYTLEITQESTIDMLFRIKRKISNKDDDFSFITDISKGLIKVFEKQKDENFTYNYIALTTPEALVRHGISPPSYACKTPNGLIVLASAHIAAYTAQGPQP